MATARKRDRRGLLSRAPRRPRSRARGPPAGRTRRCGPVAARLWRVASPARTVESPTSSFHPQVLRDHRAAQVGLEEMTRFPARARLSARLTPSPSFLPGQAARHQYARDALACLRSTAGWNAESGTTRAARGDIRSRRDPALSCRRCVRSISRERRDAGQHRHAEPPLEALHVLDALVQVVEQEGQPEPDHETHEQPQDGVSYDLRGEGQQSERWRVAAMVKPPFCMDSRIWRLSYFSLSISP